MQEIAGSNPPASSLHSELGIERRLPRHSASEDGLSFKTLCDAPSYDSAGQFVCIGMTYYYIYILLSKKYPERHYAGFTDSLDARLKKHNQGKCVRTSKYVPWEIKTAIAFISRKKAIELEKYLKTSYGRSFAKKRL